MRKHDNHCNEQPDQTHSISSTVGQSHEELISITQPLSRDEVLRGVRVQNVAYVQVVDTPSGPQDFRIDERGLTAGRSPDCEIQLLVNNVSRVHARFFARNEEYYVEDLDSTNGTYVNGTRVVRCVLRNSDQIQIGETTMVFVEERVREQQ